MHACIRLHTHIHTHTHTHTHTHVRDVHMQTSIVLLAYAQEMCFWRPWFVAIVCAWQTLQVVIGKVQWGWPTKRLEYMMLNFAETPAQLGAF